LQLLDRASIRGHNGARVDIARAKLAQRDLVQGRAAAQELDWDTAYVALARAARARALDPDDLELLATAAFLRGDLEECLEALRRGHQRHLDGGSPRRAARCAIWLVFHLANRGDFAQASGWLGRITRLLDAEPQECAEHGYVPLFSAFQSIVAGDFTSTVDLAGRAAEVGRRFGDPDLIALALNLQGRALIYEAQPARGMALLDEAMLCVVSGELSPPAAGAVYCSLIEACHELSDLRRAREWTDALSAWCARHRGLITFTGQCLVHRAEVLRMNGKWPDAFEEALRASERFAHATDGYAVAAAMYEQAEVHRERGEFSEAEHAYQRARQAGLEPQPGLALLRLAQGNADAARAAIQRTLTETTARPARARLLPACVEILLAVGSLPMASAAAAELAELADLYQTQALRAMADHALGAVMLAEGNAASGVVVLLRAWHGWRELEAPYPAACVRVRLGLARRALGDEDAAAAEFEAARAVFSALGAAADLSRLDDLAPALQRSSPGGLTARQLEVLRLLATGKTNAAIANDLVVAARTVDRHVSNIFDKLGVSSRAAATAFAYEHHLV
jgi:ATP/maltotriose-dependent transcriptional regulator MalT